MMHHMIFPKRRKIESFHNITQARELKSKSGKKQKNHLIEENVLRAACYLTDARVPGVCISPVWKIQKMGKNPCLSDKNMRIGCEKFQKKFGLK